MADALRLDFALIHKDRSRSGPQGHNRPYSGMPKGGNEATASLAQQQLAETEEEEAAVEDLTASISSLNDVGSNLDIMNAAVSIVADTDGEESTITLVGDVKDKIVFLTVSKGKRQGMGTGRLIKRWTL